MFSIQTARLTITEFTPDMAEAVHLNSLDEDNRRFLSDEVFETVEDAAKAIDFLISQYGGSTGPFVYPALLKDGTNIGYVLAAPIGGGWEIGYHIASPYTKHGYATEALKAFIPAIMKKLGIQKIYGICVVENLASQRVLEKCGFKLEYRGAGTYRGEEHGICIYHYGEN